MRKFIKEHDIQSVADLGCGDWQFSPYIYHDLKVDYVPWTHDLTSQITEIGLEVGYDVVLPVIQESPRSRASFYS